MLELRKVAVSLNTGSCELSEPRATQEPTLYRHHDDFTEQGTGETQKSSNHDGVRPIFHLSGSSAVGNMILKWIKGDAKKPLK